MRTISRGLRRIFSDVAAGKNIELYAVALVAFALAVMGVLDNVISMDTKVTAVLASVAILVFKMTEPEKQAVDLDAVLLDRQSYGAFRDFIRGAKELCIYGPSAVNVIGNIADIDREVLNKGGSVRVILQDPNEATGVAILREQLDKKMSHLLETDIKRSLSILDLTKNQGDKIDYRLLSYSPGFSIVIVDPDGKNGRAIVEFFGYSNTLINDRMHVEIHREQSQYWFEYWAAQFETMWQSAHDSDKLKA